MREQHKKQKSNRIRVLAGMLLLSALTFFPLSVFADIPEYTVKAVFLERFTRFIEWPEETRIDDPAEPFIIAVIGKNPFGKTLEKLYTEQKIKNKPVKITYLSDPDEIDHCNCHILFISSDKRKDLDIILKHTKNRPILTIADTEGFAANGVFINLYFVDNTIRFEINDAAVADSLLEVSHMLLKQAKIINPRKKLA